MNFRIATFLCVLALVSALVAESIDVRAASSSSFQLFSTFPNLAHQNPASSSSFQLNESGLSWYAQPVVGSSFQVLPAPENIPDIVVAPTPTPDPTPSGGGGSSGGGSRRGWDERDASDYTIKGIFVRDIYDEDEPIIVEEKPEGPIHVIEIPEQPTPEVVVEAPKPPPIVLKAAAPPKTPIKTAIASARGGFSCIDNAPMRMSNPRFSCVIPVDVPVFWVPILLLIIGLTLVCIAKKVYDHEQEYCCTVVVIKEKQKLRIAHIPHKVSRSKKHYG